MRSIIIEPGKAPYVKDVTGYHEIKDVIGGYLEAVYFAYGVVAYLNEEAKVNGEPIIRNDFATHLCNTVGSRLHPSDYIAGTMILFGELDDNGEFDGDEHDLDQEVIDHIMEAWKRYDNNN